MLRKTVALSLTRWLRFLLSQALILAITPVCYGVYHVNSTTAGFVYLMGILLVSASWGMAEAVASSVTALVCFSFFFLPPVGYLTIADAENWVAVCAFLATALTASHLAERARRRTIEAKEQQRETHHLYELSQTILLTGGVSLSAGFQAVDHVRLAFGCRRVELFDADRGEYFSSPAGSRWQTELRAAAAGNGAYQRLVEPDICIASIITERRRIGGIALEAGIFSDDALQALLNLLAIMLERIRTHEAACRAEAVRQSEQFKSTLLDAIAHEFKTPLTSIKVASTSLLTEFPAAEQGIRELASIIDEESDRLNLLVTDAVRTARIDGKTVRLEKRLVGVHELVGGVIADLSHRLEGRPVDLDLSGGLPPILADLELAAMALRQVVENALKYSAPATPLTITARDAGRGITIRVRDYGIGIPESERERIFDRFYRLPGVRKSVHGSGLGLYIAREILRAHGGNVWMDTPPECGSAFCLSFVPADEVPA